MPLDYRFEDKVKAATAATAAQAAQTEAEARQQDYDFRALQDAKRAYLGPNLIKSCIVNDVVERKLVTNLLTNPGFEKAGPTVGVQRNLCTNPATTTTTNMSGAAGTGGTTSSVIVNESGPSGLGINYIYRRQWSVAPTGGSPSTYYTQPTGAETQTPEGTVVSMSIWCRTSYNTSLTPRISFLSEGSTTAITSVDGADTAMVAGVWTELKVEGAVSPATATRVRVIAIRTGSATLPGVDDYIDITAISIAISAVKPPFMSGYVTPNSDLTVSWTGTANASESIAIGVSPDTYGTESNSTQTAFQSSVWKSSGTKSMKIVPRGTNTTSSNTYVQRGNLSALNEFTPGKTYTFIARVRLSAALTGTLDNTFAAIKFVYRQAGGAYQTKSSPSPANAPGETVLKVTLDLPADADACSIRFMHGGRAGSGNVWWDDAIVVEGNFDGDFFDGTNFPKYRRNYAFMRGNDIALPVRAGATPVGSYITSSLVDGKTLLTKVSAAYYGYAMPWATQAAVVTAPQNGRVRTIRFKAMSPAGTTINLARRGTSGFVNPTYALSPGVETTITYSYTGDGTLTVFWEIGWEAATGVAGDQVYIWDIVCEDVASPGSAFDGSHTPDSNYEPVWEGAEHASVSYLRDIERYSCKPFWNGVANESTSTMWLKPLATV